jgi:hypothetical protein
MSLMGSRNHQFNTTIRDMFKKHSVSYVTDGDVEVETKELETKVVRLPSIGNHKRVNGY